MRKNLIRTLCIGTLSLLVGITLWKTSTLESFETITWDMRVRSLTNIKESSDKVVLILLDQESIDWAEDEQFISWPWPRQVVSPLIDFAKRGGAKSIAFDVLYTEASSYGVYDDEAFKFSIENSNNFIGAAFLEREPSGDKKELPGAPLMIEGLDKWLSSRPKDFKTYKDIRLPIDEVTYSSKILANVRSEPERDGVYRSGKLFYIYENRVVPSLALASYLVGVGRDVNISIDKKFLKIESKKIPINDMGESILRYRKEGAYKAYRAAGIIQSELQILEGVDPFIDPSVFKDAHVLFGYSAAGLLDLRPTPISETTAGVEIHATMLDNLLSNDYIAMVPTYVSILLAFILCLGGAFLFTKYQGALKGVLLFILLVSLPIIISISLYIIGYWFPLVFIEVSLVLALGSAGVFNYATEGKQKRYIKHAFKQYLSPDFIENLLTSPEKLKLGGEKKELSIFFSDLEGFTTISEGLSPEELTSLLNEYLTAMTDIILEEGGTIDKYEGDAIIAFWNAPLDYEDHALRAVRASLRCQDKLKEMRPDLYKKTGHELYMRIGVNTGDAVVGNLGSNTRFDYTMLGDSVNLAARLEGINKQFGTYTMISKSTYDKVGKVYPVRELSRVAVVGKNEAITVFEPYLKEDYLNNSTVFKPFDRGLRLFYQGEFNKAVTEFETIKDIDPAANKYIKKCKDLIESGVENWDGVWKMTQK